MKEWNKSIEQTMTKFKNKIRFPSCSKSLKSLIKIQLGNHSLSFVSLVLWHSNSKLIWTFSDLFYYVHASVVAIRELSFGISVSSFKIDAVFSTSCIKLKSSCHQRFNHGYIMLFFNYAMYCDVKLKF